MKYIKKFSTDIFNNDNKDLFLYFAIFISAATLFYIIWPVAFAVHDDIYAYMLVRRAEIIETTINRAIVQGRFWFLISVPLSYLPFIFNSLVVYKIISYISICFSVFALAFLLYRHIGKEFALLSVLLFWLFAQIDTQHNLLISYVLSLQIPIGMVLLSIQQLLTFYKTKNKRNLIWSAVWLFAASILYESFILFSILLLLISAIQTYKNKLDIKKALFDLRYHIIFMSIYLLAYLLWRIQFPSTYNGSQIGISSIIDSMCVIGTYSIGKAPLLATLKNISMNGKFDLSMIEIGFLIKGFMASVALIVIVVRSKYITSKNAILIFALSLLGLLLPVVLLSVTPKYVLWVKSGSYAYVPSFYSYFFIIILISLATIYFYQRLKNKKIFLIIMFILAFFSSVLTDLNNKYYAEYFAEQFNRYKAFDKAVASSYFAEIENGSDIFIPDYNGIHNHMPFMNLYAGIYTNKSFNFTNKMQELKFDNPTYALKYDSNSESMLIGRISSDLKTNKVYIVSLFPLSGKTVIVNRDTEGLIKVNDEKIANLGTTAIVPLDTSADKTIVESQGIYLLNSRIIDEYISSNKLMDIQWSGGFSDLEGIPESNWRWCSDKGKLIIINRFADEKRIKLQMGIATGYPEQAQFTITSDLFNENLNVNNTGIEYTKELIIPTGSHVIEFTCNAQRVDAPNDPRDLVFRINNFKVDEY